MITETLYIGSNDVFGRYLVYKQSGQEMYEKDIQGEVKINGGYVKTGTDDYWGTLVMEQRLYGFFHNGTIWEEGPDLVFWQTYIGPTQGRFRLYKEGKLAEQIVYPRMRPNGLVAEEDGDWFYGFAQRHKPRQAAFPEIFNPDGTLRG